MNKKVVWAVAIIVVLIIALMLIFGGNKNAGGGSDGGSGAESQLNTQDNQMFDSQTLPENDDVDLGSLIE